MKYSYVDACVCLIKIFNHASFVLYREEAQFHITMISTHRRFVFFYFKGSNVRLRASMRARMFIIWFLIKRLYTYVVMNEKMQY